MPTNGSAAAQLPEKLLCRRHAGRATADSSPWHTRADTLLRDEVEVYEVRTV